MTAADYKFFTTYKHGIHRFKLLNKHQLHKRIRLAVRREITKQEME